MKVFTRKAGTSGILVAVAIALCSVAAEVAAEKIEQTSVKTNPRIVSRNAVTLVDVPNHEVGQEVQLSDIKFSNPAFKVKEEWVYNQFNFVGGSGPHRGMWVDWHEDGAQTFGTFEGAQKTVVNSDSSWTASWEGTYKYTGGTGKFKNIKGSGTYKGKASSSGDFSEDGKETVEY